MLDHVILKCNLLKHSAPGAKIYLYTLKYQMSKAICSISVSKIPRVVHKRKLGTVLDSNYIEGIQFLFCRLFRKK